MKLLWPTCVRDFLFNFSLMNFESSMFKDVFFDESSSSYGPVNKYYTNHGYETAVFLFNMMDMLFFAAILIALIPLFFLLKRMFSKV